MKNYILDLNRHPNFCTSPFAWLFRDADCLGYVGTEKFAEGLKAKFIGNEDYKILSRSSFTSQIHLECQIP